MRIILVLTVLLLCAGTAGAGDIRPGVQYEYHPPYLVMTQAELDKMQADTKLEYGADAYIRVMILDPPCLAKMEAALKAIEPWLGYTYADDSNPEDFRRAKALYYAVKRECWSTKEVRP